MENEVLVMLFVVNFDVCVFGMNAKRKVGWERPWSSCPREKGGLAVVDQRKCDGY